LAASDTAIGVKIAIRDIKELGKPQPMTSNLMSAIELQQHLNKSLVSSSQSLGWSGVLVQQYQYLSSTTVCEMEIPALSEHWLTLPLGHPAQLTQKRDDCTHESIYQLF
jgi:AraC family transcriptional regulator